MLKVLRFVCVQVSSSGTGNKINPQPFGLFSNAEEIVVTVSGLTISIKTSRSLEVTWYTSPVAYQYEVDYRLTNLEQCEERNGTRAGVIKTRENSYTITGLRSYSTYVVYVTAIGESGYRSDEREITVNTDSESKLRNLFVHLKVLVYA